MLGECLGGVNSKGERSASWLIRKVEGSSLICPDL